MNISKFIKQKPYEKIILITRKHPVTFLPIIFLFIFLLAAPVVFYKLYFTAGAPAFLDNEIYRAAAVLLASVYYLSVTLFFYTYFVAFYLDMWIITNDRLMDIAQNSLFSRTISEVDLYQVQDVTSDVSGIFHTIFNYGELTLQTAGPVPKFVFINVPRPHQLRQIILDASSEDKKFHQG